MSDSANASSIRIAGVDEVGRGPLAGPVVASACVFYKGYSHPEIKDSKKLSKKTRERLVDEIKRDALSWAIVAVGPRRIENLNIREASRLAMKLALDRVEADIALIDGNVAIDTSLPQTTVIGGDDIHVEIAAASILAKVWRDNLMEVLDEKYPGFAFSSNSGYPTKSHKEALRTIGPSKIHRRTFSGVRELVSNQEELYRFAAH
ncbi:MAG: ribonuclease HII [Bdellovibrionales bacterium]|nr:ribonuclease HII [Bdellovibrionales bacterium]